MSQQVLEDYLAQYPNDAQASKLRSMLNLNIGKTAPLFIQKNLKGTEVSLAKYRGSVTLIDFWATWCGPCKAELPNVIKTYKKFKEKGFKIIGVSLDSDRQALEKMIRDKEMTWPQIFSGEDFRSPVATHTMLRNPDTLLTKGYHRYKGLRGIRWDKCANLVAEVYFNRGRCRGNANIRDKHTTLPQELQI